jgi:Fe-S oxidoreductase
MWMEERGKPINLERVREAAETGADTLAVACPFCTVMLDDGVQSAGAGMRVVDVATLLAEGVEAGARAAPRSPEGQTGAQAAAGPLREADI